MKSRAMVVIMVISLCFGILPAAAAGLVDENRISSVEERRILVSIEDEYAKLAEREAKIDSREMQLKTLQAEVDKKLAAMQQLRNELVKLLDRKADAEGKESAN